ncbi:MAG TPA: DMT family transporter [Planococcus sp. (in: firmicutes)]|nr:DMT family transporter [Planococcus sp. (in: firmicutes)]
MEEKSKLTGIILVMLGASFWGVGGTVAQRLFQEEGISVEWLVSTRLIIAGLLLLLLRLASQKRSEILSVWKDKRAVFQLIVFGIFGMLAVQYTYMASISLGNAAVATLLQYLAPVFIILFLVLRKVSKFRKKDLIAVSMALSGTFLLLTDGSFGSLAVPFGAVVWGVLSGIALAFYTLYAGELLKKWGSLNIIGWAMIIGGASLGIFHPPWRVDVSAWTPETLLYLFFVIIFGTMFAFWFYLESLKYLMPQETSLLGSVEPLAAIVTAVLWLQIPYGAYQMAGTALILGMVVYLTLAKEKVTLYAKKPVPD